MGSRVGNTEGALLYMTRELPIHCKNQQGEAACLDRIKQALEEGMARLGYEFVRYSYWLRDATVGRPEANSFSVNFSNFPFGWEQSYNNNNMYLEDPVVRVIQDYASKKHLVYGAWHDAYDWAIRYPLGDDDQQRYEYRRNVSQLILHARECGLLSGYYYSWGDNQRQIVVSLGSTVDKKLTDDVFIHSLHSLIVLVNQSVSMTQRCVQCNKSLRIDGYGEIVLSEAELRILQLYYKNRNATQKDIAAECGRSIDTVSHHLRSVRRKLKQSGASGYVLAAYAAELNLL